MDVAKLARAGLLRVLQRLPLLEGLAEREGRDEVLCAAEEVVFADAVPVEHADLDRVGLGLLRAHGDLLVPVRRERVLDDLGLALGVVCAHARVPDVDQPDRHVRIALAKQVCLHQAACLDAPDLHGRVLIHLLSFSCSHSACVCVRSFVHPKHNFSK